MDKSHSDFHSQNAFCGSAGPEEMKHLFELIDDLTDTELKDLVNKVGITFIVDDGELERDAYEGVIDEDLPRSLSETLTSLGFDVVDIKDTQFRGKSDNLVFSFAQRSKAILFSGDLDFSNILSFPLGAHYGIVILRFPNEMSVKKINNETIRLLKMLKISDHKGILVILSPCKIRIRKEQKN
ncbi:hypothetical protein A2685_01480 [Candidatus Woesebacteria bacterium RIFCSPHIGHO2_01_FULL_37_10]|uniref:DUF5615 domain-containing protein n=1 Tax=Candidatus Woesebacteria bacterium RIFCSPHIGHO2_01_FULL_37_10 TaxID=1802489 RepID=A0A1F7XW44_9BACT|nr:MAG: hypothetical protein A2685_01480 [Candidatus Woesebacteria bacterium RIFCSPHIGHO2_01_FULL_37_10]